MAKSSFAAKTVAFVLATLLCAACLLTLAACKKKGGDEIDVENGADSAVTQRETDGVKYTFDNDYKLFVLIGVDGGTCTDPDGNELGGGRANAIFIAFANTSTKKIDLVQLDQNTMVEMNTYDRWGLSAGKTVAQLSLAYAYGGTEGESGTNVVNAIQKLTGLPKIEGYVAVDSAALRDLVGISGAVTVTLTEAYGNTAAGGQLTLTTADDFESFLREQGFGIKANEKRMTRMRDFVPAFFNALKANANPSEVDLGNNVKTNITPADYFDYDLNTPVKALEGQSQLVGDFVEFTVNQESMVRLLNGICYKKEG